MRIGLIGCGRMGGGMAAPKKAVISISQPSEFRQVCAIIDVDVVPETCRRVRLLKHGSEKPLGFYIRDGKNDYIMPKHCKSHNVLFQERASVSPPLASKRFPASSSPALSPAVSPRAPAYSPSTTRSLK